MIQLEGFIPSVDTCYCQSVNHASTICFFSIFSNYMEHHSLKPENSFSKIMHCQVTQGDEALNPKCSSASQVWPISGSNFSLDFLYL